MCGIALDVSMSLGSQIEIFSAAELDLRPSVINAVAQLHEIVVTGQSLIPAKTTMTMNITITVVNAPFNMSVLLSANESNYSCSYSLFKYPSEL